MTAKSSQQRAVTVFAPVAGYAEPRSRRPSPGDFFARDAAGNRTTRNRARWLRGRRTNLRTRFAQLLVALIGSAFAQLVAAEKLVSDDWQFLVTPYIWGIDVDGNATVKGRDVDVDTSFSDILDDLNFGVFAEGEARKGRFGVFANVIYADLEADDNRRILRIKTDAKILYLGGGVYYRLGPWNLSAERGDAGPKLVVDPYAGGRYTYLDADLKIRTRGPLFTGDRTPSDSKSWFDPIVGVRTIWALTPKWRLVAFGDVGVFGDSDSSWQAAGLLGYRFGMFGGDANGQVLAGYRALSQDYEDGSGRNKFKWDGTLKGPVLGFSIDF